MQYIIVGSLAAIATAFITVKKQALTLGAAIEAMVIILCACLFCGWFGLSFLLIAYFTIAIVDRLLNKKTHHIFVHMNKKSGPRDLIQVAANGLPATVCAVLYGLTGNYPFLIGFAAALTEALADSIASDVGVLSRSEPISICRFRRVPKGLSGGISLLGTGASFAATVFCAVIYFAFFWELKGALAILVFGNLGCLIDSIMGDLVQEKFSCSKCGCLTEKAIHCDSKTVHFSGIRHFDNCMVNLFSNALTAAAAVLFLSW